MPIDARKSEGTGDPYWDALARFHAGESSADEADQVRVQLADNAADRALLELLGDYERSSDAARTTVTVDVEAALVAVRRRLIAVDEPVQPALTVVAGGTPTRHSAHGSSDRWVRYALAVAAVLVVAVAFSRWNAFDYTVSPAQTVATQVMQQDTLTLGDGTHIAIAPGSRLSVDAGFNTSHRTVRLDGMAFFTVAHDGSHPFIVRTEGADVRDIGTAFVVRTAPGGGVVVSVTDGQVRVTRAGQTSSIDLFAGDRATVPPAGEKVQATVARKVVTADDAAWTKGRLVYRDTPVSEVLDDLRRWYGADVRADSTLLSRTLHAELGTDSLEQALRVVSLALGADMQNAGNAWHLKGRDLRTR